MFANRVSCFIGSNHQATARKTVTTLPPPQAFPRLSAIGELASTREARERDVGNERTALAGSDGKEKEREGKVASLFLPFPSLPSCPLSLIINSNIP